MPKRSSTRKTKEDFSQRAFRIVSQLTTEKKPEADLSHVLDDAKLRKQIMREMGSRGGAKGGPARAASLSSNERSEQARRAARARWDKQ